MSDDVINMDDVGFQYNLNDFDEADIEKAKQFVAEALKGLMESIAYEKAHQMIEQLRNIPFSGDDPMKVSIDLETIGNDILLAMGVAKRQREGKQNG
jgi:hypothetical protein